jgi:hypothetical protein
MWSLFFYEDYDLNLLWLQWPNGAKFEHEILNDLMIRTPRMDIAGFKNSGINGVNKQRENSFNSVQLHIIPLLSRQLKELQYQYIHLRAWTSARIQHIDSGATFY